MVCWKVGWLVEGCVGWLGLWVGWLVGQMVQVGCLVDRFAWLVDVLLFQLVGCSMS